MVKGGFWRISRLNTVLSPRTIASSLFMNICSHICERCGVRMSRIRVTSISCGCLFIIRPFLLAKIIIFREKMLYFRANRTKRTFFHSSG